jgi:anaerobic dimethyl sulfoxide reductase subunit B (iron-sulfur subunit)
VDRETCIGQDSCGAACLEVCPYDAPQFGAEDNAKMEKCNFCIDRLAENKQPICVAGCPMRALHSGPMDDLKAKYGDVKEAAGFIYAAELDPAIVLKPKKS